MQDHRFRQIVLNFIQILTSDIVFVPKKHLRSCAAMWIFFQNLKKQIVIVVLKREHSTIDYRHHHLKEISQLYYIILFNVRDT